MAGKKTVSQNPQQEDHDKAFRLQETKACHAITGPGETSVGHHRRDTIGVGNDVDEEYSVDGGDQNTEAIENLNH